jgi:hypothetical protein
MNKRIRELAAKAEEQTSIILREHGISGSARIREVFREKFAELIVQDCIDILSPYTVNMNRIGEECLHPIQEIRKHFGV